MNKNQIFSAIKRGFEISGINALSMAAGSPSVNKALQEMIDRQRRRLQTDIAILIRVASLVECERDIMRHFGTLG